MAGRWEGLWHMVYGGKVYQYITKVAITSFECPMPGRDSQRSPQSTLWETKMHGLTPCLCSVPSFWAEFLDCLCGTRQCSLPTGLSSSTFWATEVGGRRHVGKLPGWNVQDPVRSENGFVSKVPETQSHVSNIMVSKLRSLCNPSDTKSFRIPYRGYTYLHMITSITILTY